MAILSSIRRWHFRAIKVNGKPVFVIYRPQSIEKIDEMLAYWRELAHQDGLPGLYFIFQKQFELHNIKCLNSFDALFQFQPFEAINSPTYDKKSIRHSPLFKLVLALPEYYQDLLRDVRAEFSKELTLHDYDTAWQQVVTIRSDQKLTTFPGAFVDWDNTARYKKERQFIRAHPQKNLAIGSPSWWIRCRRETFRKILFS